MFLVDVDGCEVVWPLLETSFEHQKSLKSLLEENILAVAWKNSCGFSS